VTFTIRDLPFEIAEAGIRCTIGDPHWLETYGGGGDVQPVWALDCQAVRKRVLGYDWAPHAYQENLYLPIRDWRQLAGQTVRWSQAWDDEHDEANGGFYVFEHEDIPDGVLRFIEWRDLDIRLDWSGHCDIHFDDDYDEGVPFRIDAWAAFDGLLVKGSEQDDEASFRARAARFFDLDGFEQAALERGPARYEDGVEMAECWFRPRV
jgi:hypothetical protein